jgi:hypothetical protein
MNSKVTNKSADIRPLTDCEIEEVNGGFVCWPAIAYMIARLFLQQQ